MKTEGNTSHLRCGLPTFKFVCPKMTWDKCDDGKYHRCYHCEDPCTSSKSGRMIYIYPEKNLRAYPGTIRGTDEWIILIKSEPLLNGISITPKITFAFQDAEPKTKKHFILYYKYHPISIFFVNLNAT
jgi:hypothetical protein